MDKDKQRHAFVEAAVKACSNPKKQGMFECPVCKGTAIAIKSNVNGHVMASCPDCKMAFRQ